MEVQVFSESEPSPEGRFQREVAFLQLDRAIFKTEKVLDSLRLYLTEVQEQVTTRAAWKKTLIHPACGCDRHMDVVRQQECCCSSSRGGDLKRLKAS